MRTSPAMRRMMKTLFAASAPVRRFIADHPEYMLTLAGAVVRRETAGAIRIRRHTFAPLVCDGLEASRV